MGGWGSGDWTRHGSKATVESCYCLDVNRLARQGLLVPWQSGSINWGPSDKPASSVGFRTTRIDDDLLLVLKYRLAAGEPVELSIRLQTTLPHIGGRRWWFSCPLNVNGAACCRRVGKLYLYGRYFGCRHCHGLTYRSCQEAHALERSERFLELYAGQLGGLLDALSATDAGLKR